MKLMATSRREWLKENKTWLITWASIAIIFVLVVHFWPQPHSPVPASIKAKANFGIIYPRDYDVNAKSWKYVYADGSVQFSVKKDGVETIFTEQETPLAYQNDVAAYGRFIGSLRPRANFDVRLGTVSIVNFVTANKYELVGETGILNARGTLVLVHPTSKIADDEWRNLFELLKVD